MASDGKFQAATEVEISVLDVNDNSPECKQVIVYVYALQWFEMKADLE